MSWQGLGSVLGDDLGIVLGMSWAAYDIVSGGSAALLAAFLGFLISEKYGFEMVDSGDFYFLFMYLVFISFSVRPLLTTLDSSDSASSIFSLKPVATYFLNLVYLLLKKLK